jgi:hypothetical protein
VDTRKIVAAPTGTAKDTGVETGFASLAAGRAAGDHWQEADIVGK